MKLHMKGQNKRSRDTDHTHTSRQDAHIHARADEMGRIEEEPESLAGGEG